MARQKKLGSFSCEVCPRQGKCEHERPRLLEGNLIAWELVHFSQSLWKDSLSGPSGLDWTQVKAVAEILGMEMDSSIMMKLRVIEQERLAELSKEKNG